MDEQAKNEVPVYPHGRVIAMENGETEQYEASRRANIACWEAIEETINGKWNGVHLPEDAAHDVVEQFGAERVAYVLATQMQMRSNDTRFSLSNRDWAQSIPMFLPIDRRWYLSLEAHSVKLDEFITSARRDMVQIPGLEEKTKALRALPVYPHSVEYASKNKEMGQYWSSHFANIACKEALDSAISRYYRDNSLDTKAAIQEVAGLYGMDRTMHVLANSVRHISWDGRLSKSNVAWAESVPATDQPDRGGHDNSHDYRAGKSGSPGLLNLLVTEARKEYALAQERTEDGKQPSATPSKETEPEKSAEKNNSFRNVPFYPYSRDYAQDQGETELYRASRKANEACRAAIDKAITENFKNNLLPVTAAQSVLRQFGKERVSFILAHTMRIKDNDGRFSQQNRQWAGQVEGYEIYNPFGLVCQSHPAILDLFIDQTREEILLHTPLKREDIKAEAQSILTAFQQLREPNTEDGAHFAVNVSEMFVKRAKPRDMERLSNMLPFPSLSVDKGRYGTSAVISKDENRFQKLILRRPSIRAQLAEKPPVRETPTPKPRSKEAALE